MRATPGTLTYLTGCTPDQLMEYSNGRRPERAAVEIPRWCSRHMSAEALEKVILSVFQEILKNPEVTPESDFFEFGGDSNMAIDALSQISDHTGVDVDLDAIFFYPTPHELSAALAGDPQKN